MSLINENSTPPILLPCTICNRTFKPESLAKHSKVCEKTLMKKRKKFDSSRQRIQGTELAEFLPMLSKSVKVDKSPIRKSDSSWKEKHLQLMETIQAARQIPSDGGHNGSSIGRIRKLTDQEVCPHCERSFGAKAYDRHVEWCKERITRILPKSTASSVAKERLEARTKYQAPRLRQSLRARTREKYSPHRPKQSQEKKVDATDTIKKESLTAASTRKEIAVIPTSNKGTTANKLQSPVVKTKSMDKLVGNKNKSAVNLPVEPLVKRSSTSNRLGPQPLKKLDPPSTNLPKTPLKTPPKQTSSMANTQVQSQDPSPSLNMSFSKNDASSVMTGSGEGLRKEKKEVQNVPTSQGRKPSSDSAYSSLNRKSPLSKPAVTHQIDLAEIKSPSSLSSSGSESSVAYACRTERRLSTFCHECGAKYPVTVAKFCCECGVRRLSLL